MSGKKAEQFWAGANSRRIGRRIIVEGDLVLQTPASFGSGDGDEMTDMPLLVDAADGRTPLLTGATIAGALRAYLRALEAGYRAGPPDGEAEFKESRNSMTYALFGAFKGDDNGEQSRLICEDAYGRHFAVEKRDGVKIEPQSRTAVDKGLFDMQVWRPGTTFPLRFELLIIEPKQGEGEEQSAYKERVKEAGAELKQAFAAAISGLENGAITLGARKRRGFGRVSVTNWRSCDYDLHEPEGLQAWLEEGALELSGSGMDSFDKLDLFKGVEAIEDRRTGLEIDARFKLDGSLLIRSGGYKSVSPDMVHLHSYDPQSGEMRPVLPGTSIAGALRARAGRILRVLHPDSADAQVDEWLGNLFGSYSGAGAQQEAHKKQASLLTVEEHIIRNPASVLVQNRVAIDRFSGGAKDAALFNEQPAFGRPETEVRIKMRLEKKAGSGDQNEQSFRAQIGLLLLLLKDLWTGDLPLGGEISVGRGRLRGKSVEVSYRDGMLKPQPWTFRQEGDALVVEKETAEALEAFVKALKEETV